MRLLSLVLTASIFTVACQPSKKSKESNDTSETSANVEASDDSAMIGSSMIQLDGSAFGLLADGAIATKASVDCPGVSAQEIDFIDGQAYIIRKNKSLNLCTLVLREFKIGAQTFTYSSLYRLLPPVGLFEARDGGGAVIDSRLVRHFGVFSPFTNRPDSCNTAEGQKCWDYEVSFGYSILDTDTATIKNELIVNRVSIDMPSEAAPECAVKAEWKEGADLGDAPYLVISLSPCSNTIGTGRVEYGLSLKTADSSLSIEEAHLLVSQGSKKGSISSGSLDITMQLADVQALLASAGQDASILHALQADFSLALRNLGGISISYFELN